MLNPFLVHCTSALSHLKLNILSAGILLTPPDFLSAQALVANRGKVLIWQLVGNMHVFGQMNPYICNIMQLYLKD